MLIHTDAGDYENEQAQELCANCPYHEQTIDGKFICQVNNQAIEEDWECYL